MQVKLCYSCWPHLILQKGKLPIQVVSCRCLWKNARFRVRRDGGPIGNPTCKLCNSGKEDPVHFLAACNALQAEHQSLFSHAPLSLPDPPNDPLAFTEIMLGVDWIDDLEDQAFFIQLITDLKQKRSGLLINQP